MLPFSILSMECATAVGTLWLLYVICRGVYRLYFHPLARFPGPKLAAWTYWYEYYYDGVLRGMYIWKIQELHDQYGPIVRINPSDIHIRDSEFYDAIYVSGAKKQEKDPRYVQAFDVSGALFTTVSHDMHKARRVPLNPFFSKRSIQDLQNVIREKLERLCNRLEAAIPKRAVIRLDSAFNAFTAEVITHYCSGKGCDYLDDESFKADFHDAQTRGSILSVTMRRFPGLLATINAIPMGLMRKLDPYAGGFLRWREAHYRYLDEFLTLNQQGKRVDDTIFQALLDSDLPPEEKTRRRLHDETSIIIAAGTDTSARALRTAVFFLLQDKQRLQKLRSELEKVMPTPNHPVDLTTLENLSYLTAVIQEGIRLAQGVTNRLPRVLPNDSLVYKEWTIPPGTPVSQTSYFVHTDPKIFPEPMKFIPERWIKATEEGFRLDRYLTSFTKGSRMCIGINLAYAELYLSLSTIVSRFDMELFETTLDDIEVHRDYMVGMPKDGSKGVRATITGVRTEW